MSKPVKVTELKLNLALWEATAGQFASDDEVAIKALVAEVRALRAEVKRLEARERHLERQVIKSRVL